MSGAVMVSDNAWSFPEGWSETNEGIIAVGRSCVGQTKLLDEAIVRDVLSALISVYDNPFYPQHERKQAAEIVGLLVSEGHQWEGMVLESARRYADNQSIGDAFPYAPNSLLILASLGIADDSVIPFLEGIVREYSGIPRWEAIRVLCELNDEAADAVLTGIVRGDYPSLYPDGASDLKVIRNVRGEAFLLKNLA